MGYHKEIIVERLTTRKIYARLFMMSEMHCPVCGGEANSKHHIKPQKQGGTDDPRNTCWMCKRCHDLVEEMQEETGLELCPELLDQARGKLRIKLEAYKSNDIEQSWRYPNFLVWICLPGQTKRYICQQVGSEPISEVRQVGEIIDVIEEKIVAPPKHEGKGYPGKPEIDTSYLETLIYNEGKTYGEAAKELLSQGFKISRQAIWKRLRDSNNYQPILKMACKQCGKIFAPDGNRRNFCSNDCDNIYHRHRSRLLGLSQRRI